MDQQHLFKQSYEFKHGKKVVPIELVDAAYLLEMRYPVTRISNSGLSMAFELLCLNGAMCCSRGKFSRKIFDALFAQSDPERRAITLNYLHGKYKFRIR